VTVNPPAPATPDPAQAGTLRYTVPDKVVANAVPRAEVEGDNVLRIAVDGNGGGYTRYIISVSASAVRDALAKYVFSTVIETPLGDAEFENTRAVRAMTEASEYVICDITAQGAEVTLDGVPFGADDFADLPPEHWAYPYVMALVNRGVINGVSAAEFAPEQQVTREQLAKMLAFALGLAEGGAAVDFADLPREHWAYPSVAAAAAAGIVQGYGDGTFGAGVSVSRQEAAAMITRANTNLPRAEFGDTDFTDGAEVEQWARESVAAARAAGIINGFADGTFRPLDGATRAEAAKMIYAMLRLL
jgi:3-dehydroquinate dehydratase